MVAARLSNCLLPDRECRSCTLSGLYEKYACNIAGSEIIGDCHQMCGFVVSLLNTALLTGASAVHSADAFLLIDAVDSRVPDEDLEMMMRLCWVAIESKLCFGLDAASGVQVGRLLMSYKGYLDRYDAISADEDFAAAVCDYHVVRFQLQHLTGNYGDVIRDYEGRLASDELIQQCGDRVVAQYSASKWVNSSTKLERLASREVAEELMDSVRGRRMAGRDDFFIAAKYLEHHIYAKTPESGLREIEACMPSPDERHPLKSLLEACSLAILERDSYEALMLAGEEESIAQVHLDRAKTLAGLYSLNDQVRKIAKVEKRFNGGGTEMKNRVENVGLQVVIQTVSDGSTVNVNQGDVNVGSSFDASSFKREVEKLIESSDSAAKVELLDACEALDDQDESRFKTAMSSALDIGGAVLANAISGALLAYLTCYGILP